MLSREERARQFMPFDALNGFYKSIKEKEVEHIERPELSEEQIDEISEKLNMMDSNTKAKIIYYLDGKYEFEIGRVIKIDSIKKHIEINDAIIKFIDILKIEII